MAAELGFVIDEAHRGRLIDVPLRTGVVGAFENLHGYPTHADFCRELLRLARLNNGVAAEEFLLANVGGQGGHGGSCLVRAGRA